MEKNDRNNLQYKCLLLYQNNRLSEFVISRMTITESFTAVVQ